MHNPQQQHALMAQTHTGTPLALAPSLQNLASSPTLAINEAVAARRAAGRKTIHLGFGEASFPLHPLLNEALARAAKHTSYAPHARLAWRRVIPVETDAGDHHRLTPQALSEALARARFEGANPRIMIVNTPSNPTGSMFS